ncbi:conserved Plasmodium protein, unknown function [Plasmodium berghei]|uniref:RTR1 domain-containing protein, putative n=3 Tax=Plasmodium berghei TaxID=5821 RepID=A0A509AFU0_PLABA|nr:RTR1 domain-containing protein, putative [Plasmodium berghei ANKA]CXH95391.1 conserved Plasmodium protein, unknown function [Plasmodium berghei]SCL91013.1 conserved Plasmodium protein, unknown function [Plasmodium berghei]SCM17201.1 conserved Plasmodium protein, unknown function [Plasmodium berghei]VUC54146.1 RTR1 domain-containing protein, putative [Plasmodium berghei ANKA]|eukprot:XP_034419991.1 RTR1 domain-containing protein, putative [Plasmodium berghei ANKA]
MDFDRKVVDDVQKERNIINLSKIYHRKLEALLIYINIPKKKKDYICYADFFNNVKDVCSYINTISKSEVENCDNIFKDENIKINADKNIFIKNLLIFLNNLISLYFSKSDLIDVCINRRGYNKCGFYACDNIFLNNINKSKYKIDTKNKHIYLREYYDIFCSPNCMNYNLYLIKEIVNNNKNNKENVNLKKKCQLIHIMLLTFFPFFKLYDINFLFNNIDKIKIVNNQISFINGITSETHNQTPLSKPQIPNGVIENGKPEENQKTSENGKPEGNVKKKTKSVSFSEYIKMFKYFKDECVNEYSVNNSCIYKNKINDHEISLNETKSEISNDMFEKNDTNISDNISKEVDKSEMDGINSLKEMDNDVSSEKNKEINEKVDQNSDREKCDNTINDKIFEDNEKREDFENSEKIDSTNGCLREEEMNKIYEQVRNSMIFNKKYSFENIWKQTTLDGTKMIGFDYTKEDIINSASQKMSEINLKLNKEKKVILLNDSSKKQTTLTSNNISKENTDDKKSNVEMLDSNIVRSQSNSENSISEKNNINEVSILKKNSVDQEKLITIDKQDKSCEISEPSESNDIEMSEIENILMERKQKIKEEYFEKFKNPISAYFDGPCTITEEHESEIPNQNNSECKIEEKNKLLNEFEYVETIESDISDNMLETEIKDDFVTNKYLHSAKGINIYENMSLYVVLWDIFTSNISKYTVYFFEKSEFIIPKSINDEEKERKNEFINNISKYIPIYVNFLSSIILNVCRTFLFHKPLLPFKKIIYKSIICVIVVAIKKHKEELIPKCEHNNIKLAEDYLIQENKIEGDELNDLSMLFFQNNFY